MAAAQTLFCCPCLPAAHIAQQLRLQGWHLIATSEDAAGAASPSAGLQGQVGLVWLEEPSTPLLQRTLQCLRGLRTPGPIQWVGVLPAEALELGPWRELVINHLRDHQTHPLSCQGLEQLLASAQRRASLLQGGGALTLADDELGMIGQSAAMAALRQQIRKVAQVDAPVLISGESGSGKELAARAIHQQSRRATGAFVAVNCGAIAPALIQSELFGHERGSFTGATHGRAGLIETAAGGTLFLDEIADLALDLQANLLRFLQEHTIQKVGSNRTLQVDARVIAASHIDLASAVASGRFREDLFYRLSVLPLHLPPLRERLSDIPALARHFLRTSLAGLSDTQVEGFSQDALSALLTHPWPGNVRELQNRMRRAVVMADQRLISAADLGLPGPQDDAALALEAVRALAEREAIEKALGRVDQNMTHAARLLGVSRMTLYRLRQKYGLADYPIAA